MLDELDHGVGVLGHTMVRPSSEEKVLQFERLGKWVSSLKGLIIKKYKGYQVCYKHIQLLARRLTHMIVISLIS